MTSCGGNARISRSLARMALGIGVALACAMAAAEPPTGYPFQRYDAGMTEAARTGKKVFLYYGRLGCGYCDKTNREAFTDPKIRDAYMQNYVLVYVDAEGAERLRLPSGERITEFELGARLNTKVTPTFIFLEPNGHPIVSIPGVQTTASLLSMDRFVRGGHYKQQTFSDFEKPGR